MSKVCVDYTCIIYNNKSLFSFCKIQIKFCYLKS